MNKIEINGSKFEIEVPKAQKIESFKIGDRVKILLKEYSGYKSYPGIVCGFEAFPSRPTIVVAFLKAEYSKASIQYAGLNADSEDIEICAAMDDDLKFEKAHVLELMDMEIAAAEAKTLELKHQRDYFLNRFAQHFAQASEDGEAGAS